MTPDVDRRRPFGSLPPASFQVPRRFLHNASVALYACPARPVFSLAVRIAGLAGGATVYSRRFGEPEPMLVSVPFVEWSTRYLRTAAGDHAGWASRIRAAAPATCGAAMEVPLSTLVAVLLVFQAEVM